MHGCPLFQESALSDQDAVAGVPWACVVIEPTDFLQPPIRNINFCAAKFSHTIVASPPICYEHTRGAFIREMLLPVEAGFDSSM